jgi:hypothetical protein
MARLSIAFPKGKESKEIEEVSSDPTSADNFDIIFNTTDNQLKIYYSTSWYVLNTLDIPVNIILESGGLALLESGYKMLTETTPTVENYKVLLEG